MNYDKGSKAFIIESNRTVREVQVIAKSGSFYTVKFPMTGGGIKLRESRLFATEEEALAAVSAKVTAKPEKKSGFRSPYDYE